MPLNESWGTREIRTQNAQQDLARSLYYATRALDETRLISSNDGFEAVSPTDFVGIHDYDVKGAEMAQKYAVLDGLYPQGWALFADGSKYEGQPVLLTEFGGIAMKSDEKGMAWGYNEGASDREEFLSRLSALAGGAMLAVTLLTRRLPLWLAIPADLAALLVIGFLAAWLLNVYACPYHGKGRALALGSFLTALAWLIASAAFSVYFRFSNPERLYGALSLVIVFLLWLYWLMICFTAGMVFNRRAVFGKKIYEK